MQWCEKKKVVVENQSKEGAQAVPLRKWKKIQGGKRAKGKKQKWHANSEQKIGKSLASRDWWQTSFYGGTTHTRAIRVDLRGGSEPLVSEERAAVSAS